MSSDEEQEWFSDGLTEEILNALARTPDLLVAARTSSFKYKGSNEDIPTIADALGVAHILEGSVRSAKDRTIPSFQIRVRTTLSQSSGNFVGIHRKSKAFFIPTHAGKKNKEKSINIDKHSETYRKVNFFYNIRISAENSRKIHKNGMTIKRKLSEIAKIKQDNAR